MNDQQIRVTDNMRPVLQALLPKDADSEPPFLGPRDVAHRAGRPLDMVKAILSRLYDADWTNSARADDGSRLYRLNRVGLAEARAALAAPPDPEPHPPARDDPAPRPAGDGGLRAPWESSPDRPYTFAELDAYDAAHGTRFATWVRRRLAAEQ